MKATVHSSEYDGGTVKVTVFDRTDDRGGFATVDIDLTCHDDPDNEWRRTSLHSFELFDDGDLRRVRSIWSALGRALDDLDEAEPSATGSVQAAVSFGRQAEIDEL